MVGEGLTILLVYFSPGSSNHAIHMAGLLTLNNLKVALNYKSVSEMIDDNSDYITYFVNLSLKKVRHRPIGFSVQNHT